MRRPTSRSIETPVGIASYLVIARYRDETGRLPSGLYFNKIMSLLHMEAKERGIDIKLPHCWYRFGDEVVRYLMPTVIDWNHEDPMLTTVSWGGDRPSMIGEFVPELKSLIEELTCEYAQDTSVQKAVDRVYATAPFQFQKDYKRCRDSLYDIMRTQVGWSDYAEDVLWPCIDSACKSFPAEDFPTVAEKVPAFRAVMEYLVIGDTTAHDYRLIKEVSVEFWEWFCYYLRLHPKAHENVPDFTLDYWSERLGVEKERFERILGDHIVQLSKADSSVLSNPILAELARVREEAAGREREIISSFDDDFDELDDFLNQLKGEFSPR